MVRQQNHIARHRVWRRQRDPLALTPDDYGPYLTSEAWYERAEAAKARARFRCQLCSSPSRLVAHHRTYVRLGRELPEDLTCLCRSCHESFHEQHELYEQGMRP